MARIPCSLTSAVSATSFTYSDAIDLSRSRYADKPVQIKCDVNEGQSTGQFDVNAVWSEYSGGTYASFITGSGTSKVIEGGTSGALYAAGSYVVPLTIVPHSGVTLLFKPRGFLKLGAKATNSDFTIDLNIIV